MSELSVVIPAVNGWPALKECLTALLRQDSAHPLEILVADRTGGAHSHGAHRLDPAIRILPAEPTTSIPRLRAQAIRAATAEIVGVIEDHVVVPSSWVDRMLAVHRRGARVVGGPIVNGATERTVDWAAFLCEYHASLRPRPAGEVHWLPGNNVTYRRDLLLPHLDLLDAGGWEDALHNALRAEGASLIYDPDVAVRHCMRYESGREYVHQRFLYSRAFAGARLEDRSTARRLAHAFAALGLPAILLARVAREVLTHPVPRPPLARPLPLIVVFVLAWAVGEVVGALRGPGDALERIR